MSHEATDTLYREICLAPYLPGGMVVAISYIVYNRLTSFYFITPFPIFFVLAGIANTQKQTDAEQREALFCQDDNLPPPIVAIFQLISSSAGQSIGKLATVSARTIQ